MTLYWWNHWFWITVVSVLATLPFTSVATYPLNGPSVEQIEDQNNNNNNAKLPLEFPLPAQTDVDDIIAGSENIPRTLLIKEEIIEKLNSGKDDSSISSVAVPSLSSTSFQSSSSSSSLSSSAQELLPKMENQLIDRSVKDIDHSVQHKQQLNNNNDETIKTNINSNMNVTDSNSNSNSDRNSSKSVIQLIPKAINQKNNHENLKELDSHTSESEISSSILHQNLKKQQESLDVVSFDNNSNHSISNSNDTNNSNVSKLSTNISLGEKIHEQLKISTTPSPSTTVTTTGAFGKAVSHIMQVTKASSKIKSKTSISNGDNGNNNENVSSILTNLDETTIGSDAISMTTILHPVDLGNNNENSKSEDGFDSELIKSINSSNHDEMTGKLPITLENVTKLSDKSLNKDVERVRKSKGLSSEYRDAFINNYSADSKSLLTRSAGQEEDFNERNRLDDNGGNVSSEALQRAYVMDAGTISGICLSVLAICCGVGTVGIVLYRRRFLNKPQALSEPDSSVYIDDSTIRDNSDEMYSLDNDSFLNSLEAMTIQNYWTDTVKHTKL
ncbi:probable serine/threonine-protein kinase DDB_G0282963 [Condylostylus longicornis]|uniref:probable serine/threonine-protein kinase DDB_G0282963 n=1 Tax=Condylostylus longicornis TaxID=2530218 RepID=UPI00244E1546|nr:probable serine/threonine-protein kinase DDB_G0282963 [Condylostylus longicornis]XP_055371115.1 probable serine/threonine-protein kinase DDB_G0282963 [Condylostylus longicornis]XP_055371116.1 probable serine/threonine-protein kinase DDB_G0282963 [Condylostylus longicornis]XP_055371117.1 probable serine/threonine-protein kinase DDB_G0282963 [Condylostylus longicornis]